MKIARSPRSTSSPLAKRVLAAAVSTAAVAAMATGLAAPSTAAPVASPAAARPVHIVRTNLTPAQIAAYSKRPDHRVIVLLRNQFPSQLGHGDRGLQARATTLAHSQRAIHSELVRLHAPNLHSFRFINALSASVSSAERARLAADPAVRAVVPDRKVTLPAAQRAQTTSSAQARATVNKTPGICGTPKHPLLQPQALHILRAEGPHYGTTGHGVRIAVFPDGLQDNIRDYIRPNGQHAIFDYRDFTGEGLNFPTGGGEAFGDASSLIAQGRTTYDLSKEVNPNLPLPKNCDIKIRGVAPGASLAVMKVFGVVAAALDSEILQGMDWAVSHDHVNVLSQSFGNNPVGGDIDDPVSIFDSEAVAHGIAVVASTGDSGVTNTNGSPAANAKGIIAVAGSTSFQDYAQLSEHGYRLGHFKGYENNNVATLSSSGFTEVGPNAPDVIAPSFGGWANCSADTNKYFECANIFAAPHGPPIEDFGGTSESCPLTAGVVALVIEAYRNSHGHRSPSPSVIKTIITSSATDLGVPAQDQGAGLVNALRAVQLARSFGRPGHHVGHNAFVFPRKIQTISTVNSAHTADVTVRNLGTSKRTLHPRVRRFGAIKTIMSTSVNYRPNSPSTPTFTYWLDGNPEPYVEHDFTVPSGYQQLVARLGYPADPNDSNQTVFEVLFDPSGRVANDSDPQGAPLGFSQVQVRNPEPGRWRAIYFSRPGSDKYSGPITISATVQKLLTLKGGVQPANATLAPGQVRTFHVQYRTPAHPGDRAESVNFGPGIGAVPILTRSSVPAAPGRPGHFSGVLTGGNGRDAVFNQELVYAVNVPKGMKNLNVDVQVANAGYFMIGSLIDPNHTVVDEQDTAFIDLTKAQPTTRDLRTFHLSWRNPKRGRWLISIVSAFGSSSGKTGTRLTGRITYNTVRAVPTGVPNSASTVIKPGKTRVATVRVTNTGNSPEIYYLDPREAGTSTYSLGFDQNPNGTLPITASTPQAIVPPGSHSFTMVANASKRVIMTSSPLFGRPQLLSTEGKTAVASITAPQIEAGEWSCDPALIGPFATTTNGATFTCAAFATANTINDDVQATGGNIWDSATDPNSPNQFDPSQSVVVAPGASTTLQVAFSPNGGESGSVVSGYLEVQNFNIDVFGSDQMVRIPYRYKVGS